MYSCRLLLSMLLIFKAYFASSFSSRRSYSECFNAQYRVDSYLQQQRSRTWRSFLVHAKSKKTATQLFTENNNTTETSNDGALNSWEAYVSIDQPTLLVADLFAIAVAAQLMGLLDVVTDPNFYLNGGWAQPIPAVPTSLGTLVQRFSILSIVWVLAALFRKDSFSTESISTDDQLIKKILRIWIDFCLLRIIIAAISAYAFHTSFDLDDIIRECYVLGLALPVGRYIYRPYLR